MVKDFKNFFSRTKLSEKWLTKKTNQHLNKFAILTLVQGNLCIFRVFEVLYIQQNKLHTEEEVNIIIKFQHSYNFHRKSNDVQ